MSLRRKVLGTGLWEGLLSSMEKEILGTGLWEGSLCSMVVKSHELIRFSTANP